MRVVATLDWYDEPSDALTRWVGCVAPFVDAVVSVDGAYRHYPDGRGRSPLPQRLALARACDGYGLELVEQPSASIWREGWLQQPRVWPSEQVKHQAELDLGVRVAGTDGWLLRLDGDEFAQGDPAELRAVLAAATDDVFEFDLYGESEDTTPYRFPVRRLIRALPGLVCDQAHYVVRLGQHYLAGHPHEHTLEAATHLPADVLQAEHRPQDRPVQRQAGRYGFYRAHAELGLS
jgi:hypothetical protein